MTRSDRDALAAELTTRLAEVAGYCPAGRFWDAAEDDRLQVSDFHVAQAVSCEARAGAEPVTPFAWSVRTVWRAATYDTLNILADPQAASDPASAYRMAYHRGDPTRWPWNWIRSNGTEFPVASSAERVLIGQRAIRLASSVARAFDAWPPSGLRLFGWRPDWYYPDCALRLYGRVDAVLQQADETAVVFVVPGPWNRRVRPQVAFSALLASFNRFVPESAIVMFPDVGSHATLRLPVDNALLAEGVDVAVRTALVLAVRQDLTGQTLSRTPGAQCHYCSLADDCQPGTEWLRGSGARRLGFPIRSAV
jgi:hypothetical protein